jgi:integrase
LESESGKVEPKEGEVMAGCRALTDDEVVRVTQFLSNPRDRLLFILGLKTGFRISELLSLRVSDVFRDGVCHDRVKVLKRNVKGKVKSREVVLHPLVKEAVLLLIQSGIDLSGYLFVSRVGDGKKLSRQMAHKMLKQAYGKAGVEGAVATHSMRKSFASRVYKNLKFDLVATRDALGHSSVSTTTAYLDVNKDEIDEAVLAG